jgi:hypothetical protein
MNKYQVKLYSKIAGDDDDATAWIAFLVNTPMTEKQLKVYYECKSLSISDVEVLEVL